MKAKVVIKKELLMNFKIIICISILMLKLILSCNISKPKILIREILIVNPIKDSYSYSNDSEIVINSQKYLLRYKAKYVNGEIVSFIKYTSEGLVNYTIEELKSDTLIYYSLGIPIKQDWKITSDLKLSSAGKQVDLIKIDNLFYKETNGSRIFVAE